jgi:hypothetical protein
LTSLIISAATSETWESLRCFPGSSWSAVISRRCRHRARSDTESLRGLWVLAAMVIDGGY